MATMRPKNGICHQCEPSRRYSVGVVVLETIIRTLTCTVAARNHSFMDGNYVPPRRGIRFVLHAVSDLPLPPSLPPSSYLLSGITRPLLEREIPRQKLLTKCLFLFIAPFDLFPLPWHECANLCCDNDN